MDTPTFVNALFWLASATCTGFMAYGVWLSACYAYASSRPESKQ